MRKPKVEDLSQYHKVGRLRMNIAKTIGRKAADIYIDDNHLKHIELRHGKDIDTVGLDALSFTKLVVNNFNQIRRGTGNSLLLVVSNGKPKVTAIELSLVTKKSFYEVRTGLILSKRSILKKVLMYEK